MWSVYGAGYLFIPLVLPDPRHALAVEAQARERAADDPDRAGRS